MPLTRAIKTMNSEPKNTHFRLRWTLLFVCIALMCIAGTVSAAADSGQSLVAVRTINTSTTPTTAAAVHQVVRAPVTLVPLVTTTTPPVVYRKIPDLEIVTTTTRPVIGTVRSSGFTFSGSVRERRYAAGVDINTSPLFTYYPLVNHKLLLLGEGKDYLGETWTDGNGDYSLTLKMDPKNSSYAYYYLVQETGGIKSLWIDVQTIDGVPRSNAAPSFWISYTAPLAGKTGSGNNFFFVTQYGTPTIKDEWISGSAMSSSLVCSTPGNSIELLGSTGNVTEGSGVTFLIFNTTHETTDFLSPGGLYIGETKVQNDGGWSFIWDGMVAGHTLVPGHDYLIKARLSEMNYIKIGILCKPAMGQYSSFPENMDLSSPGAGTTGAAGQNPQPLNNKTPGGSDPVGTILNFFSGLFGGQKK